MDKENSARDSDSGLPSAFPWPSVSATKSELCLALTWERQSASSTTPPLRQGLCLPLCLPCLPPLRFYYNKTSMKEIRRLICSMHSDDLILKDLKSFLWQTDTVNVSRSAQLD